jgi:hypothetical protein
VRLVTWLLARVAAALLAEVVDLACWRKAREYEVCLLSGCWWWFLVLDVGRWGDFFDC